MRSFESRMESKRSRIGLKFSDASNSLVLIAFFCFTQSSARSPVTSSSQRYGSLAANALSSVGEVEAERSRASAFVSPLANSAPATERDAVALLMAGFMSG